MQIVNGKFALIRHPTTNKFLKENEICIKDNESNLIYARSIKYYKFGCAEINDRLLLINFKEL